VDNKINQVMSPVPYTDNRLIDVSENLNWMDGFKFVAGMKYLTTQIQMTTRIFIKPT
jgi:hypothetical protein